jgi:hypothetical protein
MAVDNIVGLSNVMCDPSLWAVLSAEGGSLSGPVSPVPGHTDIYCVPKNGIFVLWPRYYEKVHRFSLFDRNFTDRPVEAIVSRSQSIAR